MLGRAAPLPGGRARGAGSSAVRAPVTGAVDGNDPGGAYGHSATSHVARCGEHGESPAATTSCPRQSQQRSLSSTGLHA